MVALVYAKTFVEISVLFSFKSKAIWKQYLESGKTYSSEEFINL